MILQACFELLDHFSRLLDGDFDPYKFVELTSEKFFSKGITQLATAQANDAQLIDDIVGHVVYGGRRSLICFFSVFSPPLFSDGNIKFISLPLWVSRGSLK
jgi:hypothetical protein